MKKIQSIYDFQKTVSKIRNYINDMELTLFYTADHRQNAMDSGLDMQNTMVMYFGNPKVGTLLMQNNPEISLDLPLKVAIFDENSQTMVTFELPSEYEKKYVLNQKSLEILSKMDSIFEGLSKAVVE